MRVVHVSFAVDPQKRDGATLLRAWPTLANVAKAVSDAGVDITVVQAAHRRETVYLNGIPFHFVDDTRAAPRRLPGGIPWPQRPAKILDVCAEAKPAVRSSLELSGHAAARLPGLTGGIAASSGGRSSAL